MVIMISHSSAQSIERQTQSRFTVLTASGIRVLLLLRVEEGDKRLQQSAAQKEYRKKDLFQNRRIGRGHSN